MGLIVLIIVVLICLALVLYAVQLIPLPATPPLQVIKPLVMILCILIAVLIIANKAGIAAIT